MLCFWRTQVCHGRDIEDISPDVADVAAVCRLVAVLCCIEAHATAPDDADGPEVTRSVQKLLFLSQRPLSRSGVGRRGGGAVPRGV